MSLEISLWSAAALSRHRRARVAAPSAEKHVQTKKDRNARRNFDEISTKGLCSPDSEGASLRALSWRIQRNTRPTGLAPSFWISNEGQLLATDGREMPLRPKSFALLRLLVENAGRLLSRDMIMEALWPNVFVTDDNVTQCVHDIRGALGAEAQQMVPHPLPPWIFVHFGCSCGACCCIASSQFGCTR